MLTIYLIVTMYERRITSMPLVLSKYIWILTCLEYSVYGCKLTYLLYYHNVK